MKKAFIISFLFLGATARADDAPLSLNKQDAEGIVFMASHKYKQAIRKFNASLKRNPADLIALTNRAASFQALANFDRAIADYKTVLALSPESKSAYEANIGALYIMRSHTFSDKGQYVKAEVDLKEAERYEATRANAFSERAYLAGMQGKYEECSALAEEAVQIDPSYANGWINKGACQSAAGRLEAAVASFTRAIKANPSNAETYITRGNLYMALKNCEAAKHDAEFAYKIDERMAPPANRILTGCR